MTTNDDRERLIAELREERAHDLESRLIEYLCGSTGIQEERERGVRAVEVKTEWNARSVRAHMYEVRRRRRAEASKGLKFLRDDYGDTVYEVKRIDLKKGSFVTERKVTITGSYERVVWESNWVEKERWACFCCSCYGDSLGHVHQDPYCRNHGWYGERPCDVHKLPGSKGEDDTEMPDSVQNYLRVHLYSQGD